MGLALAGCHNAEVPQSEAADVAGPSAPTASKTSGDASPSPEPNARPEAEPAPAPEPAPEPEPPSPEDFANWLAEADRELHALGLGRKPSTKARGQVPSPELEAAYAEGRAQAYYASPPKVLDWFVQAKFGPHERDVKPSRLRYAADARGPLAAYNLDLVVHSDERAYLHVSVPAAGLAPSKVGTKPAVGLHRTWVKGEAWRCLCDVAISGDDYLLFKTNGRASPHRQWGRAWVVDEIEALARDYKAATGVPLGIGDLSLATGGKISDHWTHRRGVDVDVYLLDFPQAKAPDWGPPRHAWHRNKKGVSVWSSDEKGRRDLEVAPEGGEPISSVRLRALAEAALSHDKLWYFVHDAVELLEPFDEKAQAQRPGRRYLHAKNRAFWPEHRDHVHLRWSDRPLPVGQPPKP